MQQRLKLWEDIDLGKNNVHYVQNNFITIWSFWKFKDFFSVESKFDILACFGQ